jgi:hypothetical protein
MKGHVPITLLGIIIIIYSFMMIMKDILPLTKFLYENITKYTSVLGFFYGSIEGKGLSVARILLEFLGVPEASSVGGGVHLLDLILVLGLHRVALNLHSGPKFSARYGKVARQQAELAHFCRFTGRLVIYPVGKDKNILNFMHMVDIM